MKIQHLSVIFLIIIIPISMVLSVYVGNLINVANKEASYNTMLLNSTYDAVSAYQNNTIKNEYASEIQSKERDIQASINTFFNSLASGMQTSGYTKTELNSYVPAMLYTLYDGYYVYGPYENIADVNNGQVTYNTSGFLNGNNLEYGLKPYIYYTCEYSDGTTYDIIVNYTLDNFITVTGTYNNNTQYISASGYYINTKKIQTNDIENKKVEIKEENGNVEIEPEILGEYISTTDSSYEGSNHKITKNDVKYYNYIIYNNVKYYYDDENKDRIINNSDKFNESLAGIPIFRLENNLRIYINESELSQIASYNGYNKNTIKDKTNFKDINAVKHYQNAIEFSNKVYPALQTIDLAQDVIKTESYKKDYIVRTSEGKEVAASTDKNTSHIKKDYENKKIFDYGDTNNDPELESSSFNEHRMDVIISSIESSLVTSISNFNKYISSSSYEYEMPALAETDWNRIANNVTTVSFMQGLTINNYKYYNGYSVVANNKTKEFISKDSIYVQDNYSKNDGEWNSNSLYQNSSYNKNKDGQTTTITAEYHDPRCKAYNEYDSANDGTNGNVKNNTVGYRSLDYERKTFTYKEINGNIQGETKQEVYYNQPGTSSYGCITSRNENVYSTDELLNGKKSEATGKSASLEVRRAYIVALARYKQTIEQIKNTSVVISNPLSGTMQYTVHYMYQKYNTNIYEEKSEKTGIKTIGQKVTRSDLYVEPSYGYKASSKGIKVLNESKNYVNLDFNSDYAIINKENSNDFSVYYDVDTSKTKQVKCTINYLTFEPAATYIQKRTNTITDNIWVNLENTITLGANTIPGSYAGQDIKKVEGIINNQVFGEYLDKINQEITVQSGSTLNAYYGGDLIEKTYTIRYHSDKTANPNITGKMENDVFYYYSTNTLKNNEYIRPSYTFDYWEGSNGKTYKESSSINIANQTELKKENEEWYLDLYAHWKSIEYEIAYIGTNSKSGMMNNSVHQYGIEKELTPNVYQRTFNVQFNLKTGNTNYYKKDFALSGINSSMTVANETNEASSKVYTVKYNKGANKQNGLIYNAKDGIIPAGKSGIISYDVYSDKEATFTLNIQNQKVGVNASLGRVDEYAGAQEEIKVNANTWTHIAFTYKNNSGTDIYDQSILTLLNVNELTTVQIKNAKLEITNISTNEINSVEKGKISSTFKNWKNEKTGETYIDKQKVLNLGTSQGEIVKIDSQWQDNEVELPYIYKPGYTFISWIDQDGKTYNQGDKILANKNLVLTAKWSDSIIMTATLKVDKVTTKTIKVTAEAKTDALAGILNPTYMFSIKRQDQGEYSYSLKQSSSARECTITDLTPNTMYDIKVVVSADNAEENAEAKVQSTTLDVRGTLYVAEQYWTQKVNVENTVTVKFGIKDGLNLDLDGFHIEYTITGSGTYGNYNQSTGVTGIRNNTTVFARLTDGKTILSQISTYVHDGQPPTEGTLNMKLGTTEGSDYSNTTWTNQNVCIWANNGTDTEIGHKSTTYSYWGTSWGTNIEAGTKTTLDKTGYYYAMTTAKDYAGNTTTKTGYTINIDKIVPTVSFGTNGSGGSWWNYSPTTRIYASDEGGSGIAELRARWMEGTTALSKRSDFTGDGGWAFNSGGDSIWGPSNGHWYLWVYARDNAGNETITNTKEFLVDTIAPTAPTITNPSGGNWVNWSGIDVIASSSDTNGSGIKTYQYSYDGWNWNPWDGWIDGNGAGHNTWSAERNNAVYIRAIDNAGNVGGSNYTYIRIDRTAPTAPTITNSSGGNWTNQNVSLAVSSSDNGSGVAYYQYSYDGSGWGNFASIDENKVGRDTWSAERNNTVYVRAIDNVGNASGANYTYIRIDKIAPTITAVNYYMYKPSEVVSPNAAGVSSEAVGDSGVTGVIANQGFTIEVTGSDSSSGVRDSNCWISNTGYNDNASSTHGTYYLSNNGNSYDYTIHLTLYDNAGNTAQSTSTLHLYSRLEANIILLYYNILDRRPEYKGFQDWLVNTKKILNDGDNDLIQGCKNAYIGYGVNVPEERSLIAGYYLIQGFVFSDEFQYHCAAWWQGADTSQANIIRRMYYAILRRQPSEGYSGAEVNHWAGHFSNNVTAIVTQGSGNNLKGKYTGNSAEMIYKFLGEFLSEQEVINNFRSMFG